MTIVHDAIAAEIATLAPDTRAPVVATGFGVDIRCFDDITPRCDETAGDLEILRQDAYHRITTEKGSLPTDPEEPDPDERDYGFDITDFLHRPTTAGELASMSDELAAEFLKDDRIADATVEVTYTAATETLRISARLTPEDPELGPFDLVLTLDAAGVVTLLGT